MSQKQEEGLPIDFYQEFKKNSIDRRDSHAYFT